MISLEEYLENAGKPEIQCTIIVPSRQALLHTHPSPEIIAAIKPFEGKKRWSSDGLTFVPSGLNIKTLSTHYNLTVHDPFIDLSEMEDELQALTDPSKIKKYEPKTKPYEFQDQAADLMRVAPDNGKNFALFCDPGTGKSKMAIDRACELFVQEKIRSVLLIAPKGVHKQWANEQLPIHCGTKYSAYVWDGSLHAHKLRFKPHKKDVFVWFCFNYDMVRTKAGKKILKDFLDVYDENFMIIFDESHLIKNSTSIRWQECDLLARNINCYSRLLLSGTPIAKNLCDEWAQFKMLDEDIIGIHTDIAFKQEFCVMGGKNGASVIGSKNLDIFKGLTDPYIFRARKRDLVGMPEKVYKRWSFDLSRDLENFYQEMAAELLIELEETKEQLTAANAAVKVLKLQQISNGFFVDKDELTNKPKIRWLIDEYENPRLMNLLEILDNDIPIEEKVIIWCRFRADIEHLRQFLPHVSLYHGGLSSTERERSLAKWMDKKNKDARYFLATPGSGGTGLNLQKSGCRFAVYYSNSENSIHRWQSEDRIHRIGADATQDVIYYDLVARKTRDLDILANLRMKKNISDLALGDIISSVRSLVK